MNFSDWLWQRLADEGVKHVFYLPGGGSMYLVDALVRQDRIKPICMLHEQAAGIAAEAYAQYTGGLGVLLVTSGPGGTNAITPTAAAWIDSTPLLVISGQVASSQRAKPGQRQGGPQEVDITNIVKPITKWAHYMEPHDNKEWVVNTMIKMMQENPSGPCWIDVPLNVQSARI
jgi:acetolactate synthase-1/2/3 large subunit